MKYMTQSLTFLFFFALIIFSRWIPHPPNFSPVLAIALFCGARYGMKTWTFLIPIVGLFISDMVLGFHDLMFVVYASLIPMVWLGSKWNLESKATSQIFNGVAVGFWASALFFFATNLAVWWTSGLYPLTQEGLSMCFVAALPFFHYSLLSTWLFQAVLVLGARAVEVLGRRTVAAR